MSLASVIHEHHHEIAARWTEQAQRAASARGLERPAFMNVLPVFIESLADAGEELGSFSGRRRELLESHLATRLRQGFILPEILEEIALVGRSVSWMCAALSAEQRPSALEWTRFSEELHEASTAVAEMFTRHMLEDEQTEKRYRHLIEGIGADALEPGHEPLRDRLVDVLSLIKESMGAQTAALLLFDAPTDRLVRSASVGVAREEVEQLASTANLSTFAGQVASREESTSILDAATTELAVSDSLRKSGVHALLGVRLAPRHGLVGVLYIGIHEARVFTARETRRLESLGEQLTLQLDDAKLHADLVANVDALKAERTLTERIVSPIAHDLRGPLNSVKLRAQALARHPERLEERRDLAVKIEANVERMDRMIRDLLDAHRVRAGERLALRIERIELAPLAREVADELTIAHGDRFVLRADDGLVGWWSADELRRALWNLGTNAVKYGARDRPVTITTRRTDLGAAIHVHNANAAEPIAIADQSSLFDAFSRGRSATKDRPGGWGLGLALVKGCAEAHGGRASVESTRERGTTFTIELPMDARALRPAPADAPQGARAHG